MQIEYEFKTVIRDYTHFILDCLSELTEVVWNNDIVTMCNNYISKYNHKTKGKEINFVAHKMDFEEFQRIQFQELKKVKVRILSLLFQLLPFLRNYENDYLSNLGFDQEKITDFLIWLEPELDFLLN